MRKCLMVLSVAVLLAVVMSGASFCEDAKETGYTYGVVTKTLDGSIVIEEAQYDENTGAESKTEITYVIGAEVEVDNADSIKDIVPGTEVDMEYVEKDGKREAKYIYAYSEE